jgi:prolyl-tRNA editing enzyme YbaK/EbsC (Cys-tRNA(Pro) deacylase)
VKDFSLTLEMTTSRVFRHFLSGEYYTNRTSEAKQRYNHRMAQLSPTAQKVQDALRALGFDLTVIEHAESTRTAQEAAERVGVTLGQIVKSLIFRGKVSGKPILVLTSGANRVDEKCIKEYAGEKIERANADFVREVSGYAIGGVPPFAHAQPMETYLDEDLLQYDVIWAAAGTPNAVFELTPEDLRRLTGGKAVQVK